MPGNLFTPVTIRRRSAAQGCANAHPDRGPPEGGCVRQVEKLEIGFGHDTGCSLTIMSCLIWAYRPFFSVNQHVLTSRYSQGKICRWWSQVRAQFTMKMDIVGRVDGHSQSLKIAVKRLLGPKFFFACGAL